MLLHGMVLCRRGGDWLPHLPCHKIVFQYRNAAVPLYTLSKSLETWYKTSQNTFSYVSAVTVNVLFHGVWLQTRTSCS